MRNACDAKNIRLRRNALGAVFRAANAGVQALFRRRAIPASSIRPEFHCTPPECVLTPVYNEKQEFVYNEDGMLVFCVLRIV